MDRFVAVKILNQSGEAVQRRFEREVRALGRLSRHPGVITVYETGFTEDGRPFIVMPWVEGGSLQQRLDRVGPLPWSEAAEVIADAAVTLAAAHSAGVVHADIKPANLLLDDAGTVLIADFGIAQLSEYAQTRSGSVGLTPNYAAPELVQGHRPTPASDIYGLGATLYALIEGHPPHGNTADLVALADAVTEGDIPDLDPSVPAAVRAVYARCMAKAPADRYASAAEVARGLRGEPVEEPTSSRTPAIDRRSTRAWLTAGIAAVVVLLVMAVGFALAVDRGDNPFDAQSTATASLTTEAPVTTTTPTTTHATTTTTSSVLTAPQLTLGEIFQQADQSQIPLEGLIHEPAAFDELIWVVRTKDDGSSSLIRLDGLSGAVVDITPVSATSSRPTFTDGLMWLYSTKEGELSSYDSATLEPMATYRLTEGQEPFESVTGRYADQPVVAADGTIWLSANSRADVLADVYRVDHDNATVDSLPSGMLLAYPPIAAESAVLLRGWALCTNHNVAVDPESPNGLHGIPHYEHCQVISEFDSDMSRLIEPIPLHGDNHHEYIDPDDRVPTIMCDTPEYAPGRCTTSRSAAMWRYDRWAKEDWARLWWSADEAITPAVSGHRLWTSDGDGITEVVDGLSQRSAFACWRDLASGPLTWSGWKYSLVIAGDTLWAAMHAGDVCAVDRAALRAADDPCDHELGSGESSTDRSKRDQAQSELQANICSFSRRENIEALQVTRHPSLEVGPLLTPVPSGYGSSVWIPLLEGRLLLVDLTDAGITTLATFDIGPGIGLPLVTDDGSVWVGAKGRLVRLRPAINPSEFNRLGSEQ